MKLNRLTRSCNVQGKTVLMYAIEAKLEALCDKLIEQGADINARDDIYVAPLSRIMQGSALHSLLTDVFSPILCRE